MHQHDTLDSTSMTSRFPDRIRPDPITVVPAILAALATLAAMPLLIARGWTLKVFAIPIAERFFSSDGVINPSSEVFLERLLSNLGWMLLVVACLVMAWGRLGRSLPAQLSEHLHGAISETRARGWWLPALASVLLAVLSAPYMTRGFGYDEIFTTIHFIDTASFWETLSSYKLFNNHVAYSLLARIARMVGGPSEAVLRVPALLLGMTTIVATWRVGLALVGRRAAGLAVLALACSPTMIAWSTSARGYTGLMACTSWALLAYLEILRERGRPATLQLTVALAVGAWFHLYGILVGLAIGAHLIWMTLTSPSHVSARAFRASWWSLVGAGLATFVLYMPVLPQLLYHVAQRRAGTFQPDFPITVLTELVGAVPGPLFVLISVFAAIGLASVHRLQGARASCLVAISLCPLLVLWLVIQPFDLYGRFFAYLLPPFLLLVARGLLDVTPQRSTVLAGIIFLWPMGEWLERAESTIVEEGYRGAASAVSGTAHHDLTVKLRPANAQTTIVAIGGGAELFDYYCDRPVVVPNDYISFLEVAAGAREMRCLYRPTSWQSDDHDAISLWFETHGRRFDFGNVCVYVWARTDDFAAH